MNPIPHDTSTRLPALAAGLRAVLREGYGRRDLARDLLAGVTVGIIAIPLAMALAIASGAPPQYGLYTAIVAGAIIALLGGSRYSVSGPTAAFIVLLLPITQHYGLGGLMLAGLLSGLILIAMGLMRMGALIQYIPYPVTTGFTAGIAVVIAVLQVKDFFGLTLESEASHVPQRLMDYLQAAGSFNPSDTLTGVVTLLILIYWDRLRTPIPRHLAALIGGATLAWIAHLIFPAFDPTTLGDRFSYTLANGETGQGIPPLPPHFAAPWTLPGANGQPLELNLALFQALLGPALTVALLGAIESLLCATVADGMTGKRHDPNSELIGQGAGNVIAPFFGGIPATAALARTAANVRAGARSPLAALTHAGVVLLAMLALAPVLSHVPMATLAALLLIVAWNMSEVHHVLRIVRTAPRQDVVVLLTCLGLTVVFDMVLAVGVGMVLAAFLFIHRMAALTDLGLLDPDNTPLMRDMPEDVIGYAMRGPLFFGAAQKAMSLLEGLRFDRGKCLVLLDMSNVPAIDMTGIVALQSLYDGLRERQLGLVICGVSPRIEAKLRRAGLHVETGKLAYANDAMQARLAVLEMRAARQCSASSEPVPPPNT
ncbi:MAG: C4-dicarboxylic acid transporter DauA [Halothiobacillaceae bacterium]|jgi:SulP family sulfate permease|nr:C4-dicarboxylic acid transporter DauA [Halothiobacillaceae bacterium]